MEEARKAGGGSGVARLEANIHNILGLALQMQGKPDEAAESFQKSISINLDFPNAHLNLGKAHLAVSRLDEEAASFVQAARLDPKLAEAHSSLGVISMKQGRLDEAIERFGRVVAINPDFGNVPSLGDLGHPEAGFRMDRIFMAPAGLPADRMKFLQDSFAKLMKHKSYKRFMRSIGMPMNSMIGTDYDKTRPGRYLGYTKLINSLTGK